MRFYKLIFCSLITTLLCTMTLPANRPALAADITTGSGDGVIWAGIQTSTPPVNGGSTSSGVTWRLAVTYDAGIGFTTGITKLVGTIRYDLYERIALDATTLVWIPRASSGELAQNAAMLVKGRLPLPTIQLAPPAHAGVVNVGMWFWMATTWWQPVSVTVWVPTVFGSIWARTTAIPRQITFTTQDDGSAVGSNLGSSTCIGPGTIWSVERGDDAISGCMYTYKHSSISRSGGVFVAIVAVQWSISWTSSSGSGGVLPSDSTSSFLIVEVDELQALIT